MTKGTDKTKGGKKKGEGGGVVDEIFLNTFHYITVR